MNEVRNILVGFDFGEKVSQLCYYDRREGEPVSLPVKVGTGQYTFPNVLSKKPGEEEWHFGLEVEYFVEQQDEIPVEEYQRTDDHYAGTDTPDGGEHSGGMPGDGISEKPLFSAGL